MSPFVFHRRKTFTQIGNNLRVSKDRIITSFALVDRKSQISRVLNMLFVACLCTCSVRRRGGANIQGGSRQQQLQQWQDQAPGVKRACGAPQLWHKDETPSDILQEHWPGARHGASDGAGCQ